MPPKTTIELWDRISALEKLKRLSFDSSKEEKVSTVPGEALVFLYFSATMLELFDRMDESLWMKGEDQGLFDKLAAVRRGLAQNVALAAENLAALRLAFGLNDRPTATSPPHPPEG